ncbi:unnamed protein product [Paramecium octaurelia]|uniref:Uncharacterized protein n=1 Tax=Paramecium octaurelia TaxID=43137 RepID=A0A8S1UZ20_PAROT|nr:unnamed protein product [Paramecium octaurelia]
MLTSFKLKLTGEQVLNKQNIGFSLGNIINDTNVNSNLRSNQCKNSLFLLKQLLIQQPRKTRGWNYELFINDLGELITNEKKVKENVTNALGQLKGQLTTTNRHCQIQKQQIQAYERN